MNYDPSNAATIWPPGCDDDDDKPYHTIQYLAQMRWHGFMVERPRAEEAVQWKSRS
jgi:hypothetical protein